MTVQRACGGDPAWSVGSAAHDYLLRLAEARGINLHWLLTGQGAMRVTEVDASLLHEKIALALTDALRLACGARHSQLSLDARGPAPCARGRAICVRLA